MAWPTTVVLPDYNYNPDFSPKVAGAFTPDGETTTTSGTAATPPPSTAQLFPRGK